MKGSSPTLEVFGIVSIILLSIVVLSLVIFPALGELAKFIPVDSAETVARDLSDLITTSSATTDRITITYTPSKSATYNIQIDERIVKSELLNDKKVVTGKGDSKLGINNLQKSFSDVKTFTIQKATEKAEVYENIFSVDAE